MKTVTAIARQYKVSPDTVRHYTKLGLLYPLRSEENGYRYFGAADENRLSFVLSAKKLGFTLKQIQNILNTADAGDTPCPLVRDLINQRLVEVKKEMAEAQLLVARLEIACEEWSDLPDRMPSGSSICHLIETWKNHYIAAGSDSASEDESNERT
ncbi:MAG: MerR family DNA-binding protein [Halioglobus sp.]